MNTSLNGIVSSGSFYPAPDAAHTYFSTLKDSKNRTQAQVTGSQVSCSDQSPRLFPRSRLIDLTKRSPADRSQQMQTRYDPREEEKQAQAFRLLAQPLRVLSEANAAPTRNVSPPIFMFSPRAISPRVSPLFCNIGGALSLLSWLEDSRSSATLQTPLSSSVQPRTPSPLQIEGNENKSSKKKEASIKLRLKREATGEGGQKRYTVVHVEVSSKMSGRYFLMPDSDTDDEKAPQKQPETVENKRLCKTRVARISSVSKAETAKDTSPRPFDCLEMKMLKISKLVLDAMLKFDLDTCEERVAPADDDRDDDVPLAVLKKRKEEAKARVLEGCIERLKSYEDKTIEKAAKKSLLRVYKKALRIVDGESSVPKMSRRPAFNYLSMTKLKMTVDIFNEMTKYNFMNAKLRTYTSRQKETDGKVVDEKSVAKEKDATKRHKYNFKKRLRQLEAGELPDDSAAKLKKVYTLACGTVGVMNDSHIKKENEKQQHKTC